MLTNLERVTAWRELRSSVPVMILYLEYVRSMVPPVTIRVTIEFAGLLFAGLLAGEEFVIRYGVRDAIDTLDDRSHIAVRQALIYRLRILVPAVFISTLVLAAVSTALEGSRPGQVFRYAALGVLLAWLGLTIFGTVPINEAAITWGRDDPPGNWRTLVERWERLNTIRTWTAISALALLLSGAAIQQTCTR
jgi:uncharacterized membrane protein